MYSRLSAHLLRGICLYTCYTAMYFGIKVDAICNKWFMHGCFTCFVRDAMGASGWFSVAQIHIRADLNNKYFQNRFRWVVLLINSLIPNTKVDQLTQFLSLISAVFVHASLSYFYWRYTPQFMLFKMQIHTREGKKKQNLPGRRNQPLINTLKSQMLFSVSKKILKFFSRIF